MKTGITLATIVALVAAGSAIAANALTVTLHAGQSKTVGKTTVRCIPAPMPAATNLSFTGNGGKTIEPFRLARGQTLHWTNDGDIFAIYTDGVLVNSQAHSGSSYVKPGTYTLEVNAIGNWTITIS